jgi:hypothetical protein
MQVVPGWHMKSPSQKCPFGHSAWLVQFVPQSSIGWMHPMGKERMEARPIVTIVKMADVFMVDILWRLG